MLNRHFRLLSLFALAVALAAPSGADELSDGFGEADVNGDGRLNADEYLAAVVTAFAGRDEDRDGLLTPSELPEAAPEDIAAIDRDGDGVISVGEGAGDRIVRFFDADANRDGLLTLVELRAYVDALGEESSE